MRFRVSSIVLAVIGVLLITAAAITRPVIVPYATRLPSDTDMTVHYQGTATLLDSQALATGDTAHAVASNIPSTMDRRLHVLSTDEGTAYVEDAITLHAGATAMPMAHRYAIDRNSLKAVKEPASKKVLPATGLTVGFPIAPHANSSYTFWDSTTYATAPIRYTGHATVQGRSVLVYVIDVAGPVRDPGLLAGMPPALPRTLVAGIAPAAAATLPDPVPMSYTASTTITAWVDKATGTAINERLQETITANAASGAALVPIAPVMALDMSVTPASQKHLANLADSAETMLLVLKTVAPIVALALGLGLLAIAYVRRNRPEPAAPAPEPVPVPAQGVTEPEPAPEEAPATDDV